MEINEHEFKKNRNLKFTKFIKGNNFQEWEVTAYFYAGLHLLNWFLHKYHKPTKEQLQNHYTTRQYLSSKNDLEEIEKQYDCLYDLSMLARYRCVNLSNEKVDMAEAAYHDLECLCYHKPIN